MASLDARVSLDAAAVKVEGIALATGMAQHELPDARGCFIDCVTCLVVWPEADWRVELCTHDPIVLKGRFDSGTGLRASRIDPDHVLEVSVVIGYELRSLGELIAGMLTPLGISSGEEVPSRAR